MRIGALVLLATVWAVVGTTCDPGTYNPDAIQEQEGTRLAIAVESPSNDVSVAQGSTVQIKWSAANLTGSNAALSLTGESRDNLDKITIADGIPVGPGSNQGTVEWNTAGLAGPYQIYANLAASGLTSTDDTAGRVTVIVPATFRFLAPSSDSTLDPDGTLTIRWNGKGTQAIATIRLDPDADHENGDEITLTTADLPTTAADDSLVFDGEDSSGAAIAPGTYRLFAEVTDTANDDQTIDAAAKITIAASGSTGLRITSPTTDTEFLATADPLKIEFGLGLSSESLVDVKIDRDDDRSNGNEITILSQRFVEADTESDSFDWNGTDADGAIVEDGIYKVIVLASTGSGDPSAAVGNGLIFRRSSEDLPLISLLAPPTAATVKAGQFISVKWRDEDPAEDATIKITIDDDPRADEGEPGAEDDIAEITILTGRVAKDDGVQDTFSWQIPNTLGPGTYSVFAYIFAGGGATVSNLSVAGGQFTIKDPNQP